MKKLRLTNIFHWLYAFMMFYPILCFFGNIVFLAFNQSVNFADISFDDEMISILSLHTLDASWFQEGTLGYDIASGITEVVNYFGFVLDDSTSLTTAFGGLFLHWVIVSFFYLIFDILMFPINLAHRWIDKGGLE